MQHKYLSFRGYLPFLKSIRAVFKFELMVIPDHPFIPINAIPIKNEVKYLGITISKDLNYRVKANNGSML